MRSYIPLFFYLLACAACTGKNSIPSDILPQRKMQELIWDVMVAEEYSKQLRITDTTKNRNFKKERSILYQQVFDLHKTNRQDFLKSFNYYASRPDLTKMLFDTLTVRGNKKREEAFRERDLKLR